MKFILIFCFGLLVVLTSCITISSPAWKVYDQLSDMSDKKLLQEGCNLYSFGGLGEEGWKELRLGFFVDEDKVTHVSIDEARVRGVNLFLRMLNFVNNDPKFLVYSPAQKLTPLNLVISMRFGIFKSLENTGVKRVAFRNSQVIFSKFRTEEELKRKELEPDYEESLREAIKIVQEQGLLEHPEYLKWVVDRE